MTPASSGISVRSMRSGVGSRPTLIIATSMTCAGCQRRAASRSRAGFSSGGANHTPNWWLFEFPRPPGPTRNIGHEFREENKNRDQKSREVCPTQRRRVLYELPQPSPAWGAALPCVLASEAILVGAEITPSTIRGSMYSLRRGDDSRGHQFVSGVRID